MQIVTEGSTVKCAHAATIERKASQQFVRVKGNLVLRGQDPVGRGVSSCPWKMPNQKACGQTVLISLGQSARLFINGQPVILNIATGMTNSVPPVPWTVVSAEQDLVNQA